MTKQNQSLDQRRAKHALERIKTHQKDGTKQSEYLSYVKALPATILQNGLGQAMATLLAAAKGKENDPHQHLYKDVQSWLCSNNEDATFSKGDLLEAITSNDQQHYLKAQAEAQAYLIWLKKFAAAFLNDKPHEKQHD